MTTFITRRPDGTEEVREIKQSDMMKCPHCIMVASHYRADGSCKCTDKAAAEMADWGYQWSDKRGQWVGQPETREDIADLYDLDEGGTIRSPGKFEREPWYLPILWNAILEGDGESLLWEADDSVTDLVEVSENDRARFGFPAEVAAIHIGNTDTGFIWHELLSAENVQALRAWNDKHNAAAAEKEA